MLQVTFCDDRQVYHRSPKVPRLLLRFPCIYYRMRPMSLGLMVATIDEFFKC
jgi:hypothetical protein